MEELPLLQAGFGQKAVLPAKGVEGDRPAIGPLAPELPQTIKFHQQPLERRNLGGEGGEAPLLQQPVGLIHGGAALHVAIDCQLQRGQVAGQIAGVVDGLAEAGGGGDQLPGFMPGGILLQPEGIALLLAIAAQALGGPLGGVAELALLEGIERSLQNRALLETERVDPAQVFRFGQLAFLAEQQLGFIGGALIEGGVAGAQMACQLAAGAHQPSRNGLGGFRCGSLGGTLEVVDVLDHQRPAREDEGQVIPLLAGGGAARFPRRLADVGLGQGRHHGVADRIAEITALAGFRCVLRSRPVPVSGQPKCCLHGPQELIAGIG